MDVHTLFERFKKPGERNEKHLGYLFHFKRYLSFYCSIPFVYLPLSPNQITALANFVQLLGIVCIASLSDYHRLLGLCLYYLGDLLDFVDGNIARYQNECSVTGVFLDQLGHVLIAPLFFSAIGIAAYTDSNNIIFLYLAILLAMGPLVVSFQLVAIQQFIPQKKHEQQRKSEKNNASLIQKFIRKSVSSPYYFKAELLLLAVLYNCVPALALLFAIYFPYRIFLQFIIDCRHLRMETLS